MYAFNKYQQIALASHSYSSITLRDMGSSETIASVQIDEGPLYVWHELPTDQFTASEIEDKVRHFEVNSVFANILMN